MSRFITARATSATLIALFLLLSPGVGAEEPAGEETVRAAVEAVSKAWIAAFNRGDADACADAYSEDAVMTAHPVADLQGREAIRGFWKEVLAGDPGALRYEDPQIHVLGDGIAVLSSRWSMSRLGSGLITLERWERQADGVWRLTEDRFEIREQKQQPAAE